MRSSSLVFAVAALLAAGRSSNPCGDFLILDSVMRVCRCPDGTSYDAEQNACVLPDGGVVLLPQDGGRPDAEAMPPRDAAADAFVPDAASDAGLDACAALTLYRDADGDGFGDGAVTSTACSPTGGWVVDATDCDDACDTCRPGGVEVCDGSDQDCDWSTDEGTMLAFFRDLDGDGHGAGVVTMACTSPGEGYVQFGDDCNDANIDVFAGQTAYFIDPIAGAPAVRDFDYDCDGIETGRYTATRRCSTAMTACGDGWSTSLADPPPPCGVSGNWYRCSGSTGCPAATSRTQECR